MKYNRRYDSDRHGRWCYYCHAGLCSETATQDHIVPLSKGGSNAERNKVWCCSRCNGLKADLLLEEFREVFRATYGKTVFAFEESDLIIKHPSFAKYERLKAPLLKILEEHHLIKNRLDWNYGKGDV